MKTFSQVREQAVAHIEAEEVVVRKNDNSHLRRPKHKESGQARPLRVNETSVEKRIDSTYVPYVTKRDEPKKKARQESAT